MKKNIVILTLIFLSIAVLADTSLSASRTVTLATLTGFAPYCFRIENSKPIIKETIPPGADSAQLQGFSWDVVRSSFHEVGYTIELFVVPWARAVHYLKSDKVDAIFPANKTETREKQHTFSKRYVDRTRITIYVPADSSLRWHGPVSLGGVRVGAVRGWAYGKVWERSSHINKEFVDTIAQGFTLMDKGRLDAIIGYEVAYDYMLKSRGVTRRYSKVGYMGVVDEYLMGKKSNPQLAEILSAYDQGHRLLEQTGKLDKIKKTWQ